MRQVFQLKWWSHGQLLIQRQLLSLNMVSFTRNDHHHTGWSWIQLELLPFSWMVEVNSVSCTFIEFYWLAFNQERLTVSIDRWSQFDTFTFWYIHFLVHSLFDTFSIHSIPCWKPNRWMESIVYLYNHQGWNQLESSSCSLRWLGKREWTKYSSIARRGTKW